MREVDSNYRPPGYEPDELSTAPSRYVAPTLGDALATPANHSPRFISPVNGGAILIEASPITVPGLVSFTVIKRATLPERVPVRYRAPDLR